MDPAQHNRIADFIWNIADDVLRDVYVRGKYRDVILPMTVIRRLDTVLEPTKQAVLEMKKMLESEQSKIFPNAAFGDWKITTERPLRYKNIEPNARYSSAQVKQLKASGPPEPDGMAVIRKKHGLGEVAEDLLHGRTEIDFVYPDGSDSYERVVELEPDPALRDTEQMPLVTPGGIQGFMEREVWPYAPDAWVDESKTQIGYEISFTRHFYRPKPLRTLAEIRANIEALQRETAGLLDQILVG